MNRPSYDGASTVDAPPPRGRSLLRLIVGLLLLAIIVVIVVAFLLGRKSTDKAKKDVTVSSCAADPGGGKPKASGRILNHSSKTSNYIIRLKFYDASGNSVSDGVAPVKAVDSKQTARWDLTGAQSAKGPVTCKISGVSRTHLPGQ